jgi:glucosyl-dolichyl phosphate glucuronosyltransferase
MPLSISVIVPTMNRPQELMEFVQTLCSQSRLPEELVLVDAGSVEDLEATVREGLSKSPIKLKYSRSEAGTSLQRNVAMEMASGDIFFFFDDDVLLEPNYIEKTLPCFELPFDPPVGGVLGSFNSPYQMNRWLQAYSRLFRLTYRTDAAAAKVMASGAVRWLIRPDKVVPIPVCSGGRVAFRRECFENEKWDTFLPGYTMSEDVEISYRIAKNWTLVQTPEALLFHRKTDTSRDSQKELIARLVFSRFYFFKKHMPKDARHIASFGLWNMGTIAHIAVFAAHKRRKEPMSIVKGFAKGYTLCWQEIQGTRD